MPFKTFMRRNTVQDSPQMKSSVLNKNTGLKWAAIGGIVLGFLGAMKITGNLNREFFAELMKMVPAGRTPPLHQEQQTDITESPKKNPLPPGTEATIIVK